MKCVERRGMLEHHQHVQQQASNLSMPTVASPLPIRRSSSHTRNVPVTHSQSSDRSVQRSDTVIVTTKFTTASGSVLEAPTSYPTPPLQPFNPADRPRPQKSHEQPPLPPPLPR